MQNDKIHITQNLNLSLPMDKENGDIYYIYIPEPNKALVSVAYGALKEIKKGIDTDTYQIAVIEYANYPKSDNDKVALENLLEKSLLISKVLTSEGKEYDFLEYQSQLSAGDLDFLKGTLALSLALLRYVTPAIRQSVSKELCFLGTYLEWIAFAKKQLADLARARIMEYVGVIKENLGELKSANASVSSADYIDSFLANLAIPNEQKEQIKAELV